jgi:hypothetical protein
MIVGKDILHSDRSSLRNDVQFVMEPCGVEAVVVDSSILFDVIDY